MAQKCKTLVLQISIPLQVLQQSHFFFCKGINNQFDFFVFSPYKNMVQHQPPRAMFAVLNSCNSVTQHHNDIHRSCQRLDTENLPYYYNVKLTFYQISWEKLVLIIFVFAASDNFSV